MLNPLKAYGQMAKKTVTPLDLLVDSFDEMVTSMRRAASFLEAKRFEECCHETEKVSAILDALTCSLQAETPEQEAAAKNLKRFYDTMLYLIAQVNLWSDIKLCYSVANNIQEVGESWKEAREKINKIEVTKVQAVFTDSDRLALQV